MVYFTTLQKKLGKEVINTQYGTLQILEEVAGIPAGLSKTFQPRQAA